MSTTTHDTRFPRSPVSSLSGTQQIPLDLYASYYLPTIIAGIERIANTVWYRSKVKLKGALVRRDPGNPTDPRQSRTFPPEIVERIIDHLMFNVPTLKACAATCFSWYNITIPYLHHTLTLGTWDRDKSRRYPTLLASGYKLGLLPFVKQLQFEKDILAPWVIPAILDHRSMRHLHALVNLQDLMITDLDLSYFPAGAGKYFGHFSPTLQSVALVYPKGTRRQLLEFLRLFPKLDDIEILHYHSEDEALEALDPWLIPIKGGLRGRLVLRDLGGERLLKDMIVAFGGLRFTSVYLQDVSGARLLLEACADTLQTVNVDRHVKLSRCEGVPLPRTDFPTT